MKSGLLIPHILLLSFGFGIPSSNASVVIMDGSLGPAGQPSGSASHIVIPAGEGKTHGQNLFHSFLEFSIARGESVTFTGPDSIANIIARVTGGHSSNIDGSLRSEIPSANLWLINPAGVVFGSHSSLSIDGSFHVSTANYLKFTDSRRFDATRLERQILTCAEPTAFGFLQSHPGPILFDGAGSEPENNVFFRVANGMAISAVGGDISIKNGSVIKGIGGLINLVSIRSPGEVTIDKQTLHVGKISRLGRITISDESDLGEEMFNGTGLVIKGGKLTVDHASISAFTAEADGRGLDIEIRDNLLLKGSSIDTSSGGPGRGGDIHIRSGRLIMSEGSNVVSHAQDQGKGGDVTIVSRSTDLSDGSVISTESNASGDAGNITIHSNEVNIRSGSNVLALSTADATGAGGKVTIRTTALNLDETAKISAESLGAGKAGDIIIKADNDLHLANGSKITVATKTADAGDIRVKVKDRLLLQSGSQISTSVAGGAGNGGNITIDPFVTALLGGSAIVARAKAGSGGNIRITTDNLFVSPDSTIDASSQLGIGGTVQINSPETYISGGLTRLPAVFLNSASLLARACHERLGDEAGSLTVRRYELLPDSPHGLDVQLPSTTRLAPAEQRVSLSQPYLWPAGGCSGRIWQRIRSQDRHAELEGHRT